METREDVLTADATQLKQQWEALIEKNPKLRIREAAEDLGMSEAELLATDCGSAVTRLEGKFEYIVKEIKYLRQVMTITRNQYAVHEAIGHYEPVSFEGPHGLVMDKIIDLRLAMYHWKYGFAVRQENGDGKTMRSLQFFDKNGHSIHKVFLRDEKTVYAFEILVRSFATKEQNPDFKIEPSLDEKTEIPDDDIDRGQFLKEWKALQDTHDFFLLLEKFKVTREQALRLAEGDQAERIELREYRKMLQESVSQQVPIMVFIGNLGCTQIYTGEIENIKELDSWYNIMDEEFTMHLNEEGLAEAWRVRKPTKDGVVTSLELHDSQGEKMATFFGKRKPGIPEDLRWQAIINGLAAKN